MKIKRQIKLVSEKIVEQTNKVFGIERRKATLKRQFIEQYLDKIEVVVPAVKREDIAIITTGFIAELRALDLETITHIVHETF